MIDILLYKRDGMNVGYRISGHASFADRGEDVVCAGVSVLGINTENSIDILTDDQYSLDYDDNGRIDLMMTGSISHTSSVLLQAFEIGVNSISEQYGNDYIKIRIEEV
jgi:uncharacterized protein YsxB (DUF464 family)